MFWVIAIGMVCIVMVSIWAAMRGASDTAHAVPSDVAVYKAQFLAVENDVERGVVTSEEGARLRAEVARRLLAADRSGVTVLQTAPRGATMIAVGMAAVLLVGGTLAGYSWLGVPGYADVPLKTRLAEAEHYYETRPRQAAAEAQVTRPAPPEITEEFTQLMTQLRAAVEARPDDLRGLTLLARNEANLGNFNAAYAAQAQLVQAKGTEATANDVAGIAHYMILAANGYVSPEAEAHLVAALDMDGAHPTSRYYVGVMHRQTGRPDLAFTLWEGLLRQSQPGAPWVPPIRAEIMNVAADAGIQYSLPLEGTAPIGGRGPDADDIAAASDMSPADRMQMIAGMVDGLSSRLAEEGGTPAEWAQLIRALGVLGQRDRAAAIWGEAQQVFPDPVVIIPILEAARDAGVAE
jgi:cytochrome c-type biogenesis protein CcmH